MNPVAGGLRLTQTLDRQAQLSPDRSALSDGRIDLSYRQLLKAVARMGGGLVSDGLQPGEAVAVLAANSCRYIQLIYAILWAGGIAVPLNTRLAVPELGRAMMDCGAVMLVVDGAHGDTGRWAAASCPGIRSVVPMETLDGRPVTDRGAGGGATALIFYPNIEAGEAAAVAVSHEWLTAVAVRTLEGGVSASPRMLLATPLFEPAALFLAVSLLAHGHMLFVSNGFEPGKCAALIRGEQITDMALVPSMAAKLARDSRYDPADYASLQRVHIQAPDLSAEVAIAIAKLLPGVRVLRTSKSLPRTS